MALGRDRFRALCAAIHAFRHEMDDADLKTSIVVNLDPHDFQRVMYDADPMFGYEIMQGGSVRIMDAIVQPRRLKDVP